MGLIYSMLFDKTSKYTFMSMTEYEDIHKEIADVQKDQINVPIERIDYFIEKVVDYLMMYIDIPTLTKCGHSEAWKSFVIPEDPTELHSALKEM